MNQLQERLKKLERALNLNQSRKIVVLLDYYGVEVTDEEAVIKALESYEEQIKTVIERDYIQRNKNQDVFVLGYDEIKSILDKLESGA